MINSGKVCEKFKAIFQFRAFFSSIIEDRSPSKEITCKLYVHVSMLTPKSGLGKHAISRVEYTGRAAPNVYTFSDFGIRNSHMHENMCP